MKDRQEKGLSHHLRDEFFVIEGDDTTTTKEEEEVVVDHTKQITLVQSLLRGHLARHEFHIQKKNHIKTHLATRVQSLLRGYMARREFHSKRRLAVRLQTLLRSRIARRRVERIRKSLLRVTRERLEEERRQRLDRETLILEKENMLKEMKRTFIEHLPLPNFNSTHFIPQVERWNTLKKYDAFKVRNEENAYRSRDV